jgi:CBS-domain-containing membrane protein
VDIAAPPEANVDSTESQVEKNYKAIVYEWCMNIPHAVKDYLIAYIKKPFGVKGLQNPYKRPHWTQLILTFLAVFVGIGASAVGHYYILASLQTQVIQIMVGALGASAVLLYSEWKSPLAQPRHVFGGYIICGLVGTIGRIILQFIDARDWVYPWFLTITLCIAILLMQLTRTTHPPGGAVTTIIMMSPLVC